MKSNLSGGPTMKWSRQALALACIGLADLATTLYLVHSGLAEEANPLMAKFLEVSPWAFAAAKLLLLVTPIALLEWARRRNPRLVARAFNVAIVLYVGAYVAGVTRINHVQAADRPDMEEARQRVWASIMSSIHTRADAGLTSHTLDSDLVGNCVSLRAGPVLVWSNCGSPRQAVD